MTIDVEKVSQLSKLSIDAEKMPQFEKQMNDIAKMTEMLAEVEVQSMIDDPKRAPLRDDSVSGSVFGKDKAMQNAPNAKGGCFCVPKTVE